MRKIFILLLAVSICFSIGANERKLSLHLEGKHYKSINIEFKENLYRKMAYKVEGTSNDGFNWSFLIPDSVFLTYEDINFKGLEMKNDSNSRVSTMYFSTINNKDTLGFDKLYFSDKQEFEISAKLEKPFEIKNDDGSFEYVDIYRLNQYDPEIYQTFKNYRNYFKCQKLPYNESCENFINAIKEQPDSRSLITIMAGEVLFRKVEDVKLMYDSFSEKNKKSYYGKGIKSYYDRLVRFTHFENMNLPEIKSGKPELVMLDSTKYNLVVFSASWCGACHQLIPLLKNIYKDLNPKLDMVYISIDEKSSVENWKQLIEKEEIPWRCLLAVNNVDGIKKKYFIYEIPLSYLIYPDGRFETIDIRIDKEKLYNLIRQQQK